MDYQTFRGTDVQEALLHVREALGTDALIESTRHIANGHGGALGRTFVEIVAAPSLGLGSALRGSQGRPPKDRTRALLVAAGFEGSLARALGTGGTRAARAGNRELRQWLRQRVGEKLECKTGLIETPGRRLVACVGPMGVGKTTTLAKLAARAVYRSSGACAW